MTLRTRLLCFSVAPSFIWFLHHFFPLCYKSFSEKAGITSLSVCLALVKNLIFPLLEIHVSMSPFTQQSWRSRIKTAAWGGDVEIVFLRTYLHSEGEEAKFKWISQSRARFRIQKLYTNSTPTMNAGLFIHIFLNSEFFTLLDFILIFLYISSLQPVSICRQIRSRVLSKLRKLCSEYKINYFALRSLKNHLGHTVTF